MKLIAIMVALMLFGVDPITSFFLGIVIAVALSQDDEPKVVHHYYDGGKDE